MDHPDRYTFDADGILCRVSIKKSEKEFVPLYVISFPDIEAPTRAVLEAIKERLITELDIRPTETIDPQDLLRLKERFIKRAQEILKKELPKLSEEKIKILTGILVHDSLGLGILELVLHDQHLEEVVVNNAKEPVWVYHRKKGWLKTNIFVPTDTDIYNYASMIGRRVGSQITYLNPLMDAYLPTGDRSNATLFPISSKGNTLTIRKFASRPWTITDFLQDGSIASEIAAFLWLAIQYEMNIIIAGGTASGKTSLLNVLSCFVQPNHRVISIEDTRELQLPRFLHWVPLTTRPPNPEGKGEVSMLELMINTLRMRPDRLLVGEIRRSREAEVLFEAIHTGHSVYSTLHANTSQEAVRRLTNPPIDIPTTLLGSLQLVVVMNRDRRREIRRVFQVSELVSQEISSGVDINTVYGYNPSNDTFMQLERSMRVLDEVKFYTGMTDEEIKKDLKDKEAILEWMVKHDIKDVNKVGETISRYYQNKKEVLDQVRKG